MTLAALKVFMWINLVWVLSSFAALFARKPMSRTAHLPAGLSRAAVGSAPPRWRRLGACARSAHNRPHHHCDGVLRKLDWTLVPSSQPQKSRASAASSRSRLHSSVIFASIDVISLARARWSPQELSHLKTGPPLTVESFLGEGTSSQHRLGFGL